MYEHLKAPLDYTYKNVGAHKIPCMGFADWNDTLHINGPKPGGKRLGRGIPGEVREGFCGIGGNPRQDGGREEIPPHSG